MKFIACSDLHLHSNRPLCRTDADWIESQQKVLDRLADYAVEHGYPVFVSGDIFDTPTVTPTVLNLMMQFIRKIQYEGLINNIDTGVYVCAGNHDLPYHQWDRVHESSYGSMVYISDNVEEFEEWSGLTAAAENFGTTLDYRYADCDILMLHKFAVRTERDRPPMRKSWTAEDLLEAYPNARIIIVGDNHDPWSYKSGDRLVVNCGSLMRRNAGELKHPTGFWVVDTDTLKADHVSLFDDLELEHIDTSYLETQKEREQAAAQYDDLIEQLKKGMESSYDFIATLEKYVNDNELKLSDAVVELLREVVDSLKNKE